MEQAPNVVEAVDAVFFGIVWVSAALLAGITLAMLWFVWRYHRRRHPRAAPIEGHAGLEALWIVVPALIVLGMFYYGYDGYRLMRQPPADAFEVKVAARMWDWTFEYPNGRVADRLYVPLDRAIKLRLFSADVVHSFFVPAFRIKEDAVPGQETFLWFKPQGLGPADIYCAEYCGQRHSYMISQVVVLPPEEFWAWYEGSSGATAAAADAGTERLAPAPAGAATPTAAAAPVVTAPDGASAAPVSGGRPAVSRQPPPRGLALAPTPLPALPATAALTAFERHGCLACHSFDAVTTASGGSLRGLYGRRRLVLREGREVAVLADEDYLRRAIRDPLAEIVVGREPLMPPPIGLSADELRLMLATIKELR